VGDKVRTLLKAKQKNMRGVLAEVNQVLSKELWVTFLDGDESIKGTKRKVAKMTVEFADAREETNSGGSALVSPAGVHKAPAQPVDAESEPPKKRERTTAEAEADALFGDLNGIS
jgi:hypothetical protein